MRFLDRFRGPNAGADAHVHTAEQLAELDATSPGWRAIDRALEPIYGSDEPLHWGTIVRWRTGGPDPLDGVSAYRAPGPPGHWHYVSYGLSELYAKESDRPDVSGWGTYPLGPDGRV